MKRFFCSAIFLSFLLTGRPFFCAEVQEFAAEEFVGMNGLPGFYKQIDLEGSERPETAPFKKRWLSESGQKELNLILENGYKYRHYVRRRITEEGMPACIEYIPVIESSYKPLAVPKNGSSVGLWQFMENSIANYLKKTKWIDERRDPWKSTDAALQKLNANYRQFGDWLLAIAAYNCGAGAVKRALEKTSEKNFWSLSEKKLIPAHAIAYVPNLLAVSDIVTNAVCYNVAFPEVFFDTETYSPFDDFDYVAVNHSVSLEWLSSELRIDHQILKELNPALLYGKTPDDDEYEIRLPHGMGESAVLMLQRKGADN